MKSFIAHWSEVKTFPTFGERGYREELHSRRQIVLAKNSAHAKRLVKQLDHTAQHIEIEAGAD